MAAGRAGRAAGRVLWRSTDFLVLSRVFVRAIRLEFLIAPSPLVVSRCRLSGIFPGFPGAVLGRRAGWMKRELTNFMGHITILFSSPIADCPRSCSERSA